MCSEVVRVYKFLSAEHGLDSLKNKQIKVSLLHELNDPFEFLALCFADRKTRKAWQSARMEIWKDKGIICFSDRWSNPVLWSHYADKHKGISIGLDVPKSLAIPVIYSDERPKFDYENASLEARKSAMHMAFAMKYQHWSYETEVRMALSLGECVQSGSLWFKKLDQDLQIKEVILGAYTDVRVSDIRNALSETEMDVKTARLAFNSFTVVQQRNKRLNK